MSVAEDLLKDLSAHYAANAKAAAELIRVGESKPDADSNSDLDAAALAAWTMVANQLLNLDETLCK